MARIIVILVAAVCFLCSSIDAQNLDLKLPATHLEKYFTNFPNVYEKCLIDKDCRHEDVEKSCWGYERNCNTPTYSHFCSGSHSGYVANKESQLNVFYEQADFGYVRQQIDEMAIMCEPTLSTDSSLECSKYLR